METIEERADKYLQSQGLFRGACASQILYGASCIYDGYIQGATEQKIIDDKAKEKILNADSKRISRLLQRREYMVAKACKWLKINYGHFDGSIEDLVADFRKAMEE